MPFEIIAMLSFLGRKKKEFPAGGWQWHSVLLRALWLLGLITNSQFSAVSLLSAEQLDDIFPATVLCPCSSYIHPSVKMGLEINFSSLWKVKCIAFMIPFLSCSLLRLSGCAYTSLCWSWAVMPWQRISLSCHHLLTSDWVDRTLLVHGKLYLFGRNETGWSVSGGTKSNQNPKRSHKQLIQWLIFFNSFKCMHGRTVWIKESISCPK